MTVQDELKAGIAEFEQAAVEEEARKRRRSAATLYFKAIASVCDYVIYLRFRKIPDSHAERFRILENHFILLYKEVNSVFSIYLQTYRSSVSDEQMGMMKDAFRKVKRIAESVEKNM